MRPTISEESTDSRRAVSSAAKLRGSRLVGRTEENEPSWARQHVTQREIEVSGDKFPPFSRSQGPDGQVVETSQASLGDVGGIEAVFADGKRHVKG